MVQKEYAENAPHNMYPTAQQHQQSCAIEDKRKGKTHSNEMEKEIKRENYIFLSIILVKYHINVVVNRLFLFSNSSTSK